MTIDEGFILSNKYRRAIFDGLVAGERDIQRIAKKHHIIRLVAQRVIDEFVKGGIVEKKGNSYVFTKEGEKLVESIGK
jgi:predicted transcriptional regulator